MKNISIYFLCIIFFCHTALKAQSDKNEKTSVTVFKLPSEPLPKEINSYELKVITMDNKKSQVISKAGIPGLIPKNDGTADLILEFNETPLRIYSVEVKTSEHEKTDKGIKTKYNNYYAYVKYQHPISFFVTDKSGKKLYNKTFFDNGYRELNTSEYNTYDDVRKNYQSVVDATEKSEFEGALNGISNDMNNKYGYSKYRMSILICSVKPKKFNYDNFNAATATCLKGLSQLDSLNKLVTDIKGTDHSTYPESYNPTLQLFKDAIKGWEEELKESNMTERKARIDKDLTYDLYLNLTVANIMLKNFEQARKTLNEALIIRGTWANVYNIDLNEFKARFHANYPDKF
jgi:hypothetical protein